MNYKLEEGLKLSKKKKLKLGDKIAFELLTGEKVKAEVVGLSHDNLANGKGKANTTLRFTIDGEFNMNDKWTNVGGWAKSKMRTTYCKRLFNILPETLRKAVKTVLKETTKGGGSTELESTKDKIFLFSNEETIGNDGWSVYVKEGEQYELFKKKDYKFCKWSWLRSPNPSSTCTFYYVYSNGGNDWNGANGSYGVCFALCI